MDNEKTLSKQNLWERKLLDFSLRNNLINTKLGRKNIPFISWNIETIEDKLQDNTDLSILPLPTKHIEPTEEGFYNSLLQTKDLKEQVLTSITQNKLVSFLSETELSNAVKYIYRTSRTALEENGTNSLFLALGFVKWFEDSKSDTARFAPVLLLPVNIIRKGGQSGYVIRLRDEEMILNITLAQLLKQQFKIDILHLKNLPLDEAGVDVQKVFEQVEQAIAPMKNWSLCREMMLGLFSFNKFVMYNDIHGGQEAIKQNKIIASLIENKLQIDNITDGQDIKTIDKTVKPNEIAAVLDVDSSQLKAVIESANDKSFILYGPPGTGKSQTITNIIANALYHGKRVLFVAEKMAALEVVQRRLEKIGLGDFCLELHSNKVSKKHFLAQMQKALDVVKIKPSEEYKKTAEELFDKRKELIAYNESLHQKDKQGFSLYDLINNYLRIQEDELKVNISDTENITPNIISDWQKEISTLEISLKIINGSNASVLRGLDMKYNDEKTENNIKKALSDYAITNDYTELLKQSFELLNYLDIRSLEDDKFLSLHNQVKKFKEEKEKIESKWLIAKIFAKKQYEKSLRQYTLSVRTCLDELKEKCKLWIENYDKRKDWYLWSSTKAKYSSSPFIEALYYIESTNAAPDTAVNSFIKTVYHTLIAKQINENANLRQFNGLLFDEVINKYRKDASYFQELTKQELYCRLASNIPSQTTQAMASSEMGILKRNILSSGRGNSIRNIIDKIPTLLPKLTPCMLMSPISVAQFLNLKDENGNLNDNLFDLVIFDEASQMPTSEAIGAIARGKNLIVVGDPKQMPPTSFFATTQTEDEEADIDDMESILDDCISLSLPEYYLSWHYRSKHESLITFSNSQYYDNRLYTFPSVDDREKKVKLVEIEGVYDKGRTRSNIHEAKAIVGEVIRRLKDTELRKKSIGIVSFSKVQQNLIEDLLEEQLNGQPELADYAYNSTEPIFIKNLENVQGDERDVILFSVGYGPDKDGKVSMNFGPLNNIGGERRLNVAVSRARYEMTVFSSLKPEQIDLNRTSSKGAEGLKAFLEFAKGDDNLIKRNNTETKSANEVINQIANELISQGYEVNLNVGRSKFKVDLAVADKNDKNRYILGILCDGEMYNSTPTARDREIVQPNVLKMLNWRVMRVWSVDFYNNKERVIKQIIEEIESAAQQKIQISEKQMTDMDYKFNINELKISNSANNTATCENTVQISQNKRPIEQISYTEIEDTIIKTLSAQGMMPKNDLKRQISKSLGYARLGNNIDRRLESVLDNMISLNEIEIKDNSEAVRLINP